MYWSEKAARMTCAAGKYVMTVKNINTRRRPQRKVCQPSRMSSTLSDGLLNRLQDRGIHQVTYTSQRKQGSQQHKPSESEGDGQPQRVQDASTDKDDHPNVLLRRVEAVVQAPGSEITQRRYGIKQDVAEGLCVPSVTSKHADKPSNSGQSQNKMRPNDVQSPRCDAEVPPDCKQTNSKCVALTSGQQPS